MEEYTSSDVGVRQESRSQGGQNGGLRLARLFPARAAAQALDSGLNEGGCGGGGWFSALNIAAGDTVAQRGLSAITVVTPAVLRCSDSVMS